MEKIYFKLIRKKNNITHSGEIPLDKTILPVPYKTFSYKIIPLLGLGLIFILPSVLNPPFQIGGSEIEILNIPFPFDKCPEFGAEFNLKKGKNLIAFLSLSCPHCRFAGRKLSILYQKKFLPPAFIYFLGDEEKVDEFIKYTGSNFPYKMFNEPLFFEIAGPSIPVIYLLENGKIKKKLDLHSLTENELI